MLYIAINVIGFERNETRVIYETIILSAIIIISFPIIYCLFLYDKKIERYDQQDELCIFYAVFYRRTKTKSKLVRWKSGKKYKPDNIIYASDTRMHSNIIYE
jgi:hypothetical protein